MADELLAGWCVRTRSTSEAEFRGYFNQVGERVSLHLLRHLSPVCLHRDLADAELVTDLLIRHAGDDQCHDFLFALGERRVTFF